MANRLIRRIFCLLLVILFLFNLSALPVTASEEPSVFNLVADPQTDFSESTGGLGDSEEPVTPSFNGSPDNPFSNGEHPPQSPAAAPENGIEPGITTPAAPETAPTATPAPASAPAPTPTPPASAAPASNNAPQGSANHEYIPTVIPEDGQEVLPGQETTLTVTFTKVDNNEKIAAAALSIPYYLTVNAIDKSTLTEGWECELNDSLTIEGFSAMLKFWATTETAKLGKGQSVGLDITVTASGEITNVVNAEDGGFKTGTWSTFAAPTNSEAPALDYETRTGRISLNYSEPRLNVPVSSTTDLENMRTNLNWHYVQTADIAFAEEQNFTPIGGELSAFLGSFNGKGYSINELTINRPDDNYSGLFAVTGSSALLNNINLINCYIEGLQHVGGLTGRLSGGSILNSTVAGVIKAGKEYAGGLSGDNIKGAQVTNSSFTGTVTGSSYVGGLTGYNSGSGSIIQDSNASGEVKATGTQKDVYVGGLVGSNCDQGTIVSCFSTADVCADAGHSAGGLAGENSSAEVSYSYASGLVQGQNSVGGLIGFNRAKSKVISCYATGSVEGVSSVGGLIGTNHGLVNYCFASGVVAGADMVGGLAGNNIKSEIATLASGIIESCYATGSITAQTKAGGLVGSSANSARIFNCYATGTVEGESEIGGLVGNNGGPIMNCYATGLVTELETAGGLVGTCEGSQTVKGFYLTDSPKNKYGTQVTPIALKDPDTFDTAVWSMQTPETYNPDAEALWFLYPHEAYPILWWQYPLEEPAPPEQNTNDEGEDENEEGGNHQNLGPFFGIPNPGLIFYFGDLTPRQVLHSGYLNPQNSVSWVNSTLLFSYLKQLLNIGSNFSANTTSTAFQKLIELISQVVTLLNEAHHTQNQQTLAQAEAAYQNLLNFIYTLPLSSLTTPEKAIALELLTVLEAVFKSLTVF